MAEEFLSSEYKFGAVRANRPDFHDFLFINSRPAYIYACVEEENTYLLSVIWLDDNSSGSIKYSTMTPIDSVEGLPKGKVNIDLLENIYRRFPEKLNNLKLPIIFSEAHKMSLQGRKMGEFAGFYSSATEQ
jgi:hypothetical protein